MRLTIDKDSIGDYIQPRSRSRYKIQYKIDGDQPAGDQQSKGGEDEVRR